MSEIKGKRENNCKERFVGGDEKKMTVENDVHTVPVQSLWQELSY